MYEYKVWEPQGPDNDEEGKTEGRAGRGNIEPSRNRETETRGLWTRARAHETQPHEYTGAGGGERSQTLERGRALSKVSGSTRIRRNVDITRRENKKRVLRRKKTKGIHTHIRGITLSAKHNERVTGSSTGRGYVVFDEMAGHGEDAAVMLGIAPGLAIAGLYGSITDPRITGPPLEEAVLESTGHEETTSRQGGAEGKHHGTLAGVQVRAESTLPVTARLILPYQIEETPVYLEAASEGTQGEDRIGKILCCAGEHQWELNLATLRDTELEPGAVRVVKVSTRLSIETKHVSGNRLGSGEQPVAEIVGDETGKLLNRRVDTTGNRYLAAGRPLPGLWWHRYKTDLWRSRSQEAAPNRNCGSARPRKTEMAIAARTAVAKMHSASNTRDKMDADDRMQEIYAELPDDILLLPTYHGNVPQGLHHPVRSAMVSHIKKWSGETEADLRKRVVAHTWAASYSAPWIYDTSRRREAPFQKISPVAELNERMYKDSIKEGASSPDAEGTIRGILREPEKYRLDVVTAIYQALVDSHTGDGTLDSQTGNARLGDRRQADGVKVTLRIAGGQQLVSECNVFDANLDTRKTVEEAMELDRCATRAVGDLQEAAHKCEVALTQQRKVRHRMSEERKRKRDSDPQHGHHQ